MAGKQMGQKPPRSGQQSGQKHDPGKEKQQQQGNFGQDDARRQQEKESELSHMGEMTREGDHKDKAD